MILDFIKPCQAGEIRLLKSLKDHDVQRVCGAYILMAEGRFRFRYPRGTSPIYYIGQTRNLHQRLDLHRRFVCEAGATRKLSLYYPRYEYGCAIGARYVIVRPKRNQRPKALEDELLTRFAYAYRAWPVANGTGSWSHVNKLFASLDEE